MAKKEEAPDMVERFAEFKELKNIDKTTMIRKGTCRYSRISPWCPTARLPTPTWR